MRSMTKKGSIASPRSTPQRVQELASPATLQELKDDRGTVVYPQFKCALEPSAEQRQADGSAAWLNAGMGFYTRGEKPKSPEFLETTQELQDIVKIVNEAARAGAEDMLWMSWLEAKSRRKRAPSRYSGLIALSAVGARKLLSNFDKWCPPGNFDTQLRRALETDADCKAVLAAGYLLPALGHYSEHNSALFGGTTREAYWTEPFIAQSTRGPSEPPAAPWDGTFKVRRFLEKGHAEELHPGFSLPEQQGESFTWWTAAITVAELPAGRLPTIRTVTGNGRAGSLPSSGCQHMPPSARSSRSRTRSTTRRRNLGK